MLLSGLQKLTLLDYPGKLAATVFFGGCNFRCPFCHNASLVINPGEGDITEEQLMSFLDSRRGRLEAVCISGGEPTLRPELPSLINSIKEKGFLVKLDTNGYRPDVLKSLVSCGLIDYVAMDIKNSKEGYARTVDIPKFDIAPVCESVEFLLSGKVDYEFRTTVVKELHTAQDIVSIARWIKGAKNYFLQSFRDSGDIIKSGFSPYADWEIETFLASILPYVPNAQIRA